LKANRILRRFEDSMTGIVEAAKEWFYALNSADFCNSRPIPPSAFATFK
jgi:hypothetical protein